MIKYFVRTTGKRKYNYNIEYTVLCDPLLSPVDSFIKQLKCISEYDAVLLEDDVSLCENFQEEVEKAISLYPDYVINFFADPKNYFTTHASVGFSFNQCTYYPKGIAKKIADKMERLHRIFPDVQYDVLENQVLNEFGMPHIKYRPCLVQHLDLDTLIQEKPYERRTIYFIDYLRELGIDYKDAYYPENRKKLTNKMNEHIKTFISK